MRILGADNFTGTHTSLDVIPKSYLRTGDICMVKSSDKLFWYRYEIGSFVSHNIPTIIIPVDNINPAHDDGGRWILVDIFINTAYINKLRTNTISPGVSSSFIDINNIMTVSPSGVKINGPLEIYTECVSPIKVAPFIVNCDEKVDNLNVDKLDGYDSSDFITKETGWSSLPYPCPSGSASPSAGPRWVYLSFSKPALNTNYSVFTTITNMVDSDPSIYATTITEKTTAGFKCEFSGDTDSPNYKLEYVAVGDFEK